jgi:hypothetical protein
MEMNIKYDIKINMLKLYNEYKLLLAKQMIDNDWH